MPRRRTVSPEELSTAEAQATADAAFLEELQTADAAGEIPDAPTPEENSDPTIADRFVAMAHLVVEVRQRTRLSESSLIKTLELAMNYHIWSIQKAEQDAQRAQQMNPQSYFGSEDGNAPLVTPETVDEYIGADETPTENVVEVDFTPAEEGTPEDGS